MKLSIAIIVNWADGSHVTTAVASIFSVRRDILILLLEYEETVFIKS